MLKANTEHSEDGPIRQYIKGAGAIVQPSQSRIRAPQTIVHVADRLASNSWHQRVDANTRIDSAADRANLRRTDIVRSRLLAL